eukprot:904343-Rhodomonas_salina.1
MGRKLAMTSECSPPETSAPSQPQRAAPGHRPRTCSPARAAPHVHVRHCASWPAQAELACACLRITRRLGWLCTRNSSLPTTCSAVCPGSRFVRARGEG